MLLSLPRAGTTPPLHLGTPPALAAAIPTTTLTLARWTKISWLSPPGVAMSSAVDFRVHAFGGNPLRRHLGERCPPGSALESLTAALLLGDAVDGRRLSPDHKVLPFSKGRPLARNSASVLPGSAPLAWRLGWLGLPNFKEFPAVSFVYLGTASQEDGGAHYWAIDATAVAGFEFGGEEGSSFIELRSLMVAADWGDGRTMDELAVAGHAKALLEWHNTSRFCGHCGATTVAIDAGRRKQCTNDSCKKRIYPRIDPVVIMLIIDKTNDRALLGRKSRYVPRMWSCLAGFIEPGESLEEAVRRETWEETGIEVGDVVYHSSQPWPVGPSSKPCQLMVGFFAYAKSFEICLDKEELEDAQWHSREDVKKALTFAEYEKAQRTAADKVNQMCKSVEKVQSLSKDFNLESGALAPMFVPGPHAIAHHLVSSWLNQSTSDNDELPRKRSVSFSNL